MRRLLQDQPGAEITCGVMASRYLGKTWPGARRGQEDISGFPSPCLPSTYARKGGDRRQQLGCWNPGQRPPILSSCGNLGRLPGTAIPAQRPLQPVHPGYFIVSKARREGQNEDVENTVEVSITFLLPISMRSYLPKTLGGRVASRQPTPAAAASVFCLGAAENTVAISYARLISLKAACGQVKWTSP